MSSEWREREEEVMGGKVDVCVCVFVVQIVTPGMGRIVRVQQLIGCGSHISLARISSP